MKTLSHKTTPIRKRRSCFNRDGATLVESALILPFFLLLIFSSVEFTRMSMMRNLTQDAAYYAARTAMVPGATADEAEAEARRILGYLGTDAAQVFVNESTGGVLDENSDVIEVRIVVPLDQNTLIFPQFTQGMTFESTARMRSERYDGFYDPFDDGSN